MPHRCSNIPESIFYSALKGEFLRIARATLKLEDFIPKAQELTKRMEKQGATHRRSEWAITKLIGNHTETFAKYLSSPEEIARKVVV